MKTAYKLETYTGAILDHTITNDALNIYYKQTLTDAIGYFKIILPSKPTTYNDIALFDKVKIYAGEDSVPANPTFVGRVTDICGNMSGNDYTRTITGLDQGEILLRRILQNIHVNGTLASTLMVALMCTNLGLGNDITADTINVYKEIPEKTYFEVARDISDYWYDVAQYVSKDFYVDTDNKFVWCTRPKRTAGTETLLEGNAAEKRTLLSYNVFKSVEKIKNKIWVYGAFDTDATVAKVPSNDNWTESLSNWTAGIGTLALDGVNHQVGSYSVQLTSEDVGPNDYASAYRTPLPEFNFISGEKETRNYSFSTIKFQHLVPLPGLTYPTTSQIRFMAPNAANYFYKDFTFTPANAWQQETHVLGDSGGWTSVGSPTWDDLEQVWFYFVLVPGGAGSFHVDIDAIYLMGGRHWALAEDAISQTDYGVRELIHIDELLPSPTYCARRGGELLKRLKDPLTQIDVKTPLNTNIWIGDQLSMTLPTEGISAENFSVIATETNVVPEATTSTTMLNSNNIRRPMMNNMARIITEIKRQLAIVGDAYERKQIT